jgi:hypothetical protein
VSTTKTTILLALLIATGQVYAGETELAERVKFSGFGTLAAVRTDTDKAEFATTINPTRGAGKSVNFSNDSKLGVQADIKLSQDLSAVVQLVSLRNGYDNNDPRVEIALLKYDVSSNFTVRAGRIPLAAYMVSDYRNVGYAQTWVRPPVEVYNTLPFPVITGVDALYRTKLGDASLSLQPLLGDATWIAFGGKGTNRVVAGMNATYEKDDWQVRGIYFYAPFDFHSDFVSFFYNSLYASKNEQLITAGRARDPQPYGDAHFYGLSTTYDDGIWLAQAETVFAKTFSIFPGYRSAFATVARRYGNLMPYATFSASFKQDRGNSAKFPAGAQYDFYRQVVDGFGSGQKQKTVGVGLKWNFMKNMDLKVQLDHTMTKQGSANMFVNAAPDFSGRSVNIYSTALDFVF